MENMTFQQRKVLDRVSVCRTEFLGQMVYRCENEQCGHVEHRYISCKNRACSVCSWLPREKWRLQRENDIIPDTPYYHNVFTIPHEFSEVASQNQVAVQKLLFKCVEETLKSFSQSHCKGGLIGFMLVLHTWSTRLLNHYHIHATIPGGYFLDGAWHEMNEYLFPARALADVFKGKFCSGLRRLYRKGSLRFDGHLSHLNDAGAFGRMVNTNHAKKWHVHSERTRGKKPEVLMGYFANYVFKTAIDHSRISRVDETAVEFAYRSHDEDGGAKEMKNMVLAPHEFLRRFAGHIQPRKFTRIRYYGFLGGGVKQKYLKLIFAQKKKEYEARNQKIHRSSCEAIQQMGGRMEVAKCPCCNSDMLSPWEIMRRTHGRGPPDEIGSHVNETETQKACA
jgi:hypothetical protein